MAEMAPSDRLLEIDSTEECSYSTDSKPSLLDRLKSLEPFAFAKKQKMKTNLPVVAKKSQ